jgi:hypothetical protein
MHSASAKPPSLTVVSIGYDKRNKLVVRANNANEAAVGARLRIDIDIPTDHVTFAKLAAYGVRVVNEGK